jgi:hypothetical protein
MARHISTTSGIVRNACGNRKVRNVVAGVCADALRTLDLARQCLTRLVEHLRSTSPAQAWHAGASAWAYTAKEGKPRFATPRRSRPMSGSPRRPRLARGF